jgi:arylsulfatase
VNLRVDPFERHMEDPAYPLYAGEKLWTVLPAAALVQAHIATFAEFPPSQAPPNFSPQAIVDKVIAAAAQRHGS